MSKTTAFLLRFLHIFITLFILVGCFSPWPKLLWIHLFFVPLVLLHWGLNRNRCFLTDWEYRLKGISPQDVKHDDGFVRSLLEMFIKNVPSPKVLRVIIRSVTVSCWVITVARLWHQGAFVTTTVTVMHEIISLSQGT